MTRLSTRAQLIMLAALSFTFAAGCSFSTVYAGPQNVPAYKISCNGGRWACAREAKKVCQNKPYIVLEEDEGLGILTGNDMGSLRIQCVGAHAPAVAQNVVEAPHNDDPHVTACKRTYADVGAVAKNWRAFREKETSALTPTEDAFVDVCVTLPDQARVCLNPRYETSHEGACRLAFGQIPQDARERLDAVF